MTKLTSTEFTLTGLELIKLIREFIGQRCDAAGLQSHDRWYDTLKLWERNEITEEEFGRRHGELMLRGTLRSITACKEFIQVEAQVFEVADAEELLERLRIEEIAETDASQFPLPCLHASAWRRSDEE